MNDEEKKIVYISIIIPSSISFLASLFIICIYLCYRSLRSNAFKLIVYLQLFDSFRSLAFILPAYAYSSDSFICIFQSYIILIFCQCCNIWTFIVGLYLYLQVCKNNKVLDSYLDSCFLGVFVIALIIAIIPFSQQAMGYNIGWCGIKQSFNTYILITYYVPLWNFLLMNIFFYYKVIAKVKIQFNFIEGYINKIGIIRKLKLYPMIGIVCLLPITIERMISLFYTDNILLEVHVASAILMCLNGLFNALIYGFNTNVRDTIYKTFIKRGPPERLISHQVSSDISQSLSIYN